jgi:hypothetical protein
MKAADVIESYVRDVAAQLPHRLRSDVAVELRSLLTDELNAKGHDPSSPDAALALVRDFGRPSEVAARYHAPYAVIEPSDTRSYVLAAIVGASVIPNAKVHLPMVTDQNVASILFLAWLGALVLFFAARSWARRRWPDKFQWKPSAVRDRDLVSLPAQLGILLVSALALALYISPGATLSFFSGGRIDARDLAYTQDFQQPLRFLGFPLLFAVFAALNAVAVIRRRWTSAVRGLSICFLIAAALQLGWHANYGEIFVDPGVDRSARAALQIINAVMMILAAIEIYREWRRIPAPGKATELSLAAQKWRSFY